MLSHLTLKRRTRARLSLFLLCALTLATLPILPARATRASVARDDKQDQQIQSVQIPVIAPGSAYRQTNLISDIPGIATFQDPLLVNPWGITVRGTSPFWIANNGTSTTQLVRGDVGGAPIFLNPNPRTINIPGGLPTGVVGNSTTDFQIAPPGGGTPAAANFIFDSITGNITAWNGASGSTAQTVKSMPGHVWTGLAIGSNSGGNRLYAADFANNHIDVFDGTFTPTTVTGGFIDATIPAGYAPFNIQNLGGSLYVTYAKVGMDGKSESGVGNGFVRKFNTDGVRDLTFAINNGALNAPWGLTIAPAAFGIFGNALLVGNFGEGNPSIHAYNPTTGAFVGTLQDESGNGIVIDELWSLTFGNGGNGGDVNTLYFTAGTSEEEHGLFGKLNPTTSQATSLIQFATDNFAVDESVGHVDFTVVRTGDTSGSATVQYATFDESQAGHASQKSDYEIAEGVLRFAPGETIKTFSIFIVDDKFVEGDETVDLMLSNPTGTGVGLGSPNVSELTILDNDVSPSATNPIDNTDFFVRQQYLDFLNREPEAGQPWTGILNGCPNPNNNDPASPSAKCDRVAVSESFFLSAEYQGRGYFATRFYRAAFGRDPLYGEFMGDMSRLSAGTEASKATFANEFTQRPEFVATLNSLTNAQYVDRLIANTGVTFPAGFRDQEVAALDASTKTRAQVLRDVVEQPAFASDVQTFNRAFILAEYFGYLRRDPDTAGFNTWVNYLNAHPGDFRTMVSNFENSTEYRQRFGAS